MSKQNIIEQLNKNRKVKLLKDTRQKFDILATLRVSKKGSEENHEKVAIIHTTDGRYLWKDYTGNLPNSISSTIPLDPHRASLIVSVIKGYEAYKLYHVNPYTWLITSCLYRGLDLVKEGYITL